MTQRIIPSFLIASVSAFAAQLAIFLLLTARYFEVLVREPWVYLFAATVAFVAGCFGASAYRRNLISKFVVGSFIGLTIGGAAVVLPIVMR